MELTNEQRKYLGLELIDSSWDRVLLPTYSDEEKIILYFDGDIIRKIITIIDDTFYNESSICLKTFDNRTMILPKTNKGKQKKLTKANLEKFSCEGMYFSYYNGYITLANYTTQQTYYSSEMAGIEKFNINELASFLDDWISNIDKQELEKINTFAHSKRKHCKFQEGDFFRFKIDRIHYGYGRILQDIAKIRKSGIPYWDILMGKPLVVSVYHIITENPNINIQELNKLNSCPSQFIMDNRFYYGEYEIIGHLPLDDNIDYPIMYGQSISWDDWNKIMFQKGYFYKEIPLNGNSIIGNNKFRNNGISWGLYLNKNILEACIKDNSNKPYWDILSLDCDLRNPINKRELLEVIEQMGYKE